MHALNALLGPTCSNAEVEALCKQDSAIFILRRSTRRPTCARQAPKKNAPDPRNLTPRHRLVSLAFPRRSCSEVTTFQYKSGIRYIFLADPARKPQLFSTSVAHKVHFGSSSWNFRNFQYKCSIRRTLWQLRPECRFSSSLKVAAFPV